MGVLAFLKCQTCATEINECDRVPVNANDEHGNTPMEYREGIRKMRPTCRMFGWFSLKTYGPLALQSRLWALQAPFFRVLACHSGELGVPIRITDRVFDHCLSMSVSGMARGIIVHRFVVFHASSRNKRHTVAAPWRSCLQSGQASHARAGMSCQEASKR